MSSKDEFNSSASFSIKNFAREHTALCALTGATMIGFGSFFAATFVTAGFMAGLTGTSIGGASLLAINNNLPHLR